VNGDVEMHADWEMSEVYQYVRYLEDDSGVMAYTESQVFGDMMNTVERVMRAFILCILVFCSRNSYKRQTKVSSGRRFDLLVPHSPSGHIRLLCATTHCTLQMHGAHAVVRLLRARHSHILYGQW
jgi:hypothetical protein